VNLRLPPSLSPGDRIRIVAPAGPVREASLAAGVEFLSHRFRVEVDDTTRTRHGYFSAPDDQRRRALQDAFDDPGIRAVIAARGGYGTSRVVDRIDFTGLAASPKWVVGSSDLTALLVPLFELGLAAIHGPMAASFERVAREDWETLVDLLVGLPWSLPPHLTTHLVGEANGPLVGGNLTVLAHLCGRLPSSLFDGAVLLLEDVGEAPYRLDRALSQLLRAGLVDRVAGFVLGEFTDCQPGPDGTPALEALLDVLSPLGRPVASSYPAAHGRRNHPFIHGATARLSCTASGARLSLLPVLSR